MRRIERIIADVRQAAALPCAVMSDPQKSVKSASSAFDQNLDPARAKVVCQFFCRAALLIDVNSADFHTLQLLPEIGPTLARRIIDDRPYSHADDLQRVRGIGPITAAQLAPHITFVPRPTP